MRIKKIGFILLLLTFPLTSIFAQISDQEKRFAEEIFSESSKLNYFKTPLKNEIDNDRFFLLRGDDSIRVLDDTNKSFWSLEIGIHNTFLENAFAPPMIFGCAFGEHLGKSWYLIMKYCRVQASSYYFASTGNEFMLLFGGNPRFGKLQFIYSAGPCIYIPRNGFIFSLGSEIDVCYNVFDRTSLSVNFRWSLIDRGGILVPNRNSSLSLGIKNDIK